MARSLKSAKRKLGTKLDKILFGIPENRAKFMRTGQKNPAAKRRKLYQAGYVAGNLRAGAMKRHGISSPPAPDAALGAVERTALFREAAIGDVAVAREFFLAGYADGIAESKGNPGSFARCVQSVAAKLGARDPRAVCASAGRKKLGQAEMTRRAKAGKRKAAIKNTSPTFYPALRKTAKHKAHLRKLRRERRTEGRKAAIKSRIGPWIFSGKRNPRNPIDTAAAAYEGFHGEKSKRTIVVQDRRHFHTHVWALGPLVYLKVWLPSDRRKAGYRNYVEVEFDYEGKNPVLVTANEKRNQMFFDGGDQSVDLKTFGVPAEPHETVVLGEVSDAYYFTTKAHLGKDGGTAVYKHKLGEEGGELPTLIYHTLEKRLSLAGGSYTIPNEGVRN